MLTRRIRRSKSFVVVARVSISISSCTRLASPRPHFWVVLALCLSLGNVAAVRIHKPGRLTTKHDSAEDRNSRVLARARNGAKWTSPRIDEPQQEGPALTTASSDASRRKLAVTSPDDHLVTSPLPLWSDPDPFPTQHWAGHVPASENDDKYFFYWLFEPPSPSNASLTVPIIIWLNGGPGCSSMDGLWIENGPFRLGLTKNDTEPTKPSYGVYADPNSWHLVPAYTLYVDQPVGTGLSYTKSKTYPTNDDEVNVDFYHFLQSFFQLHADKFVTSQSGSPRVNRPLYFSGESHAGHYIPSMMNHILTRNDELESGEGGGGATDSSTTIRIPVSGAAIGNGWMDPYRQYSASEVAYGKGLIDKSQWHALDVNERECQDFLSKGEYDANICFDLLSYVVDQSFGGSIHYRVSTYDARRSEPKRGSRSFPPGHKVVETYLGGWDLNGDDPGTLDASVADKVLEVIHATAAKAADQVYMECTDPPYNALSHQDGKGVVPDVVAVLQHKSKPRLLFFNGMEDLICNHVGNEKMLENLPWSGKEEWIQSTRYAWQAKSEEDGKLSGYMKEYENLGFLKILNAGHMVPMDVPEVAQEMMQIFVSAQSFDMSKQSLQNAPEASSPSCPACPTCPTCEDCSTDSGKETPSPSKTECQPCPANSSESQSSKASGTVSYDQKGVLAAFVAVAFVLGGFLTLFVMGKRGTTRSLVPQYDVELRERNNYTDVPENGFA